MTSAAAAPETDLRQLRLLAIFHFVAAGLAVLGLLFLFGHYLLMQTFLSDPSFARPQQGPDPARFFALFRWFYLVMGLLMVAGAVGNVLSGLYLRRQVHRTFSFVIAVLNCLHIPVGTILGVFTIVALSRESVKRLYADGKPT